MLSLLTINRNFRPPARHAFTRLPKDLKGLPLSQALFRLLASVWNRQYVVAYSRAEELYSMLRLPDFPDPELGSTLADMTVLFVGTDKYYVL